MLVNDFFQMLIWIKKPTLVMCFLIQKVSISGDDLTSSKKEFEQLKI